MGYYSELDAERDPALGRQEDEAYQAYCEGRERDAERYALLRGDYADADMVGIIPGSRKGREIIVHHRTLGELRATGATLDEAVDAISARIAAAKRERERAAATPVGADVADSGTEGDDDDLGF